MKTGIVLQVRGPKTTVLLNGGEFIQVRTRKDWAEGMVVTIEDKKFSWNRYASLAAGILLFFCLGIGGGRIYYRESLFISMDINPSIEISVNRFDRIIRIQARNRDADKILSSVSVKNMKYADGISAILECEEMQAYLTDNSDVTFAVQTGSFEKEKSTVQVLTDVSDTVILPDHHNADIEYLSVSREVVENAHAHGTTPGKYVYLQKLQESDPQTDIDTCKHHSISRLKEEIEAAQQGCGRTGNNTQESGGGCHHGWAHH